MKCPSIQRRRWNLRRAGAVNRIRQQAHAGEVMFLFEFQAKAHQLPHVVTVVKEIEIEVGVIDVMTVKAVEVAEWWRGRVAAAFLPQPPVSEPVLRVIILVERRAWERNQH